MLDRVVMIVLVTTDINKSLVKRIKASLHSENIVGSKNPKPSFPCYLTCTFQDRNRKKKTVYTFIEFKQWLIESLHCSNTMLFCSKMCFDFIIYFYNELFIKSSLHVINFINAISNKYFWSYWYQIWNQRPPKPLYT